MNEKPLLIGRLAKLSGVRPDTIRFYERIGLLPKAQRLASGYRIYDDAALKQVRFIRKAQALGFSLDEIQRIMNLRGHGKETCRSVVAMAEATLSETQAKLKDLQRFRDALAHHRMKMSGPDFSSWPVATLLPLFFMWAIMMIAMMLPSALPMILTFAALTRNRQRLGHPYVPMSIFVAGYVAIWCVFSALAAAAQWWLHRYVLLSTSMVSTSAWL